MNGAVSVRVTEQMVVPLRRITLTFGCAAILSVFSLCGCNTRSTTPEAKNAPADSLHTEAERGPVSVRLDVVPAKPQLSDEPTLTVTITAADGVDISTPPFGESVGEFLIRDFHEPPPEIRQGQKIIQQIYTLEPTHAGTMIVDPIVVRFVDNRSNGDGREHTLETDALRIPVTTIIESEAPSLADLHPASPPVDLPEKSRLPTILLAVTAIAGVLLLLFRAVRRRRRAADKEPEIPPDELARRELDELIASGLSQTDVKAFFAELTGVVRRYIERSTGVRAPEQTTEEFLREVRDQQLFPDEDSARLGAFLESADLVKFAGFQPDPEAIKQSTHRAKQFIELKSQKGSEVSA